MSNLDIVIGLAIIGVICFIIGVSKINFNNHKDTSLENDSGEEE